jgi:hypothetical protein
MQVKLGKEIKTGSVLNMKNDHSSLQKEIRLNKAVIVLTIVFLFLNLAIVIASRMPFVPSQYLNKYLGWITCVMFSVPFFYWLIFTKNKDGRSPLLSGLLRSQGRGQKAAVLITPVILCFSFYILGSASTSLITSFAFIFEHDNKQAKAEIIKIQKGVGWYRGTSKIHLKLEIYDSSLAIYWSNEKILQDTIAEGRTVLVQISETRLGNKIRSISVMHE